MREFEILPSRLAKSELPISHILHIVRNLEELNITEDDELEALTLLGLPIIKTNEAYATLKTRLTPIEEQLFCIVDIETSGNSANKGQIIELGAIMIKNGVEIDRFDYLTNAQNVPENILELTGIEQKELDKAPSLGFVLEKFRLFLKDAVFVAHNVNFDFYFISDTLEQLGFGPLLNRKLCTIDLAKKTIKSERYGLEHLKDLLNLNHGEHHRAFWDAYNTAEIFKEALKNLPKLLYTTEELIYFTKPNQKKHKKNRKKQDKSKKKRVKQEIKDKS